MTVSIAKTARLIEMPYWGGGGGTDSHGLNQILDVGTYGCNLLWIELNDVRRQYGLSL